MTAYDGGRYRRPSTESAKVGKLEVVVTTDTTNALGDISGRIDGIERLLKRVVDLLDRPL